MATPFPAVHTRANQAAADKAEQAKAALERALELLETIDELLLPTASAR